MTPDGLIPMATVMDEIERERERQDQLWGRRTRGDISDLALLPVLMEEVGEVSECLNEHRELREELVQVAAVAVLWLQILPP